MNISSISVDDSLVKEVYGWSYINNNTSSLFYPCQQTLDLVQVYIITLICNIYLFSDFSWLPNRQHIPVTFHNIVSTPRRVAKYLREREREIKAETTYTTRHRKLRQPSIFKFENLSFLKSIYICVYYTYLQWFSKSSFASPNITTPRVEH